MDKQPSSEPRALWVLLALTCVLGAGGIGFAAGYSGGADVSKARAEGARAGRVRGAAGSSTISGTSGTPGSCGPGRYTTSSGTCASYPSGYGTPPVNSPEGKKILKTDPGCKNTPPPPPDYKGPIQCNNP